MPAHFSRCQSLDGELQSLKAFLESAPEGVFKFAHIGSLLRELMEDRRCNYTGRGQTTSTVYIYCLA